MAMVGWLAGWFPPSHFARIIIRIEGRFFAIGTTNLVYLTFRCAHTPPTVVAVTQLEQSNFIGENYFIRLHNTPQLPRPP